MNDADRGGLAGALFDGWLLGHCQGAGGTEGTLILAGFGLLVPGFTAMARGGSGDVILMMTLVHPGIALGGRRGRQHMVHRHRQKGCDYQQDDGTDAQHGKMLAYPPGAGKHLGPTGSDDRSGGAMGGRVSLIPRLKTDIQYYSRVMI